MAALISCGVQRLPSMPMVQSVPICRLTEATVRWGLTACCRRAALPTRRSPISVNATTLGVVRSPLSLGITTG